MPGPEGLSSGNEAPGPEHVRIFGPDGQPQIMPLHEAVQAQLTASPEVLDQRLEAAEDLGDEAVEQTVEVPSSTKTEAKEVEEQVVKVAEEAGELTTGKIVETEPLPVGSGAGSARRMSLAEFEPAIDPIEDIGGPDDIPAVSEAGLKGRLSELGVRDEMMDDVLLVIQGSDQQIQAEALKIMKVDSAKIPEVVEKMGWSGVRLKLDKLHKEVGLPEDSGEPDSLTDQAQRIIKANLDDPAKMEAQLVDLGFLKRERSGYVNRLQAVRKIITASNVDLLSDKLKELDLPPEKSTMIAKLTDRNVLKRSVLKALELDSPTITEILRAKDSLAKSTAEDKKSLAKSTAEDKRATDLHISKHALDRAHELGYKTADIINIADHPSWQHSRREMAKRGIELPGLVKPDTSEESRKYTDEDWIHNPNTITKAERLYYERQIREDPAGVRASLLRPVDLIRPRGAFGRLLAPGYALANLVYRPIGLRRLAGRLAEAERQAHPNENYGSLGLGREKLRQKFNQVRQMDETIKRVRRELSPLYRNTTRGANRRLPRINLAQDVAVLKRELAAIGINSRDPNAPPAIRNQPPKYHGLGDGSFELESVESGTSKQFVAEHQKAAASLQRVNTRLQPLADLGVRKKSQQKEFDQLMVSRQKQQRRFEQLNKVNEKRLLALGKHEYEELRNLEVRTPTQQARYEQLRDAHPEWHSK